MCQRQRSLLSVTLLIDMDDRSAVQKNPQMMRNFAHYVNTVSLTDFIFPMNDMFDLGNEPYNERESENLL